MSLEQLVNTLSRHPFYKKEQINNRQKKLFILKKDLKIYDGAYLIPSTTQSLCPISYRASKLFSFDEKQQEFKEMGINFLLLDQSFMLELAAFRLKSGWTPNGIRDRVEIDIYVPYRVDYQQDFQINCRYKESFVFYEFGDKIDLRFIQTSKGKSPIHRLAKISDGFPFGWSILHQTMSKDYPIYKELINEKVNLPITWNEALASHNKRELFSERLKKDAGKKANKRSYFVNYTYQYLLKSHHFTVKELLRIDNYLANVQFSQVQLAQFSKADKRSFTSFRSFLGEFLLVYLTDKYPFADKNYLQDVVNMIKDLNEKELEFNFTSESGLKRYHDELLRKLRNRRRKADKKNFVIPTQWKDFVIFLRYKKKLRRLKSPLDLVNEGENMHNCVGGYSGSVKAGNDVIYHYDSPSTGLPYTIEFCFRYKDKGVYIAQMFTKYNRRADDQDRKIIQDLVDQFNRK